MADDQCEAATAKSLPANNIEYTAMLLKRKKFFLIHHLNLRGIFNQVSLVISEGPELLKSLHFRQLKGKPSNLFLLQDFLSPFLLFFGQRRPWFLCPIMSSAFVFAPFIARIQKGLQINFNLAIARDQRDFDGRQPHLQQPRIDVVFVPIIHPRNRVRYDDRTDRPKHDC
jgi:hypothetical protein